jgi:hypothetical protein
MMPVMGPWCPTGGMITPIPPMMGSKPQDTPSAGGAKAGGMAGMSHGHARRDHQKRQMGFSVFIGGGGAMGSGNPFSTRPDAPIKAGYWVGPAGNMQLTSELVNYHKEAKDIYLTLDVEWSPGKEDNMYDVGMGALSADRCEDRERGILHPPKDKPITYKGEQWTAIDNGYFINWTPHIHDGGVDVKVYINDQMVCESKAIYGAEGGSVQALDGQKWQTITGYTPCEKPIPFKRGDKVSMSSTYDLTKYRL